jgi:hypothetical protein
MRSKIVSVHVDIAEWVWEVLKISKESALSSESGGIRRNPAETWLNKFTEALATGDKTIHPFAAKLLSEAEGYQKSLSDKNRENVQKRWNKIPTDTTVSDGSLNIPNHTTDSKTVRQTVSKKEKKDLKEPSKKREPDLIWDKIESLFFQSGIAKSENSRVGKLSQALKEKKATPEQMEVKLKILAEMWPNITVTPETLVKHWDAATPKIDPQAKNREAHKKYLQLSARERD